MTEKAIKARKEYLKKWRAENKEKVARQNERYWEKRASELNSAQS